MHLLKNNEIVLVRSIVFQGKPTGTVYIRSDMEELNHRLLRYVGIAGVVLLVSLLAALLVSSIFRRSVAEPIVHLAQVAGVVSHDKNYSVRATPIPHHGELSILIDAFNEMLAQIDRNEQDLRKAHDELELRVQERTAELQAAKEEVEGYSQDHSSRQGRARTRREVQGSVPLDDEPRAANASQRSPRIFGPLDRGTLRSAQ